MHELKDPLQYRNTPYSELLKGLYLFVFMVVQTYPFKGRIFHDLEALNGTFELKVREQNQLGFWNSQLLEQVLSKSADPYFQPLEHFLRQ